MFLFLLLLHRLMLIISQKTGQIVAFFLKNICHLSVQIWYLSSEICLENSHRNLPTQNPVNFLQNQPFFSEPVSKNPVKFDSFLQLSKALITVCYNTPEQRKNQILSQVKENHIICYTFFTFCTLFSPIAFINFLM